MEKQPSKDVKYRLLFIALLVLLSFVAGITGEIFTRAYLSKLNIFRDFYFTETSDLGQRDLVIKDPKKVVVEQDIMLNQLVNDIQPTVLGLYLKKKTGKVLLDNLYSADELLGQSFVLTSDGWLISSSSAVNKTQKEMAVIYNNKVYDIEKIVRDEQANCVFIKINAQNLPVVKLADIQNLLIGQQVFVVDSHNKEIYLANVIDKSYRPGAENNNQIISSEDIDKYLLINKTLPENMAGSPIFNLEGSIIGFWDESVAANSKVIPANYLNQVLNQVLKGEEIKRPYLGIKYVDLTKVIYNSAYFENLNTPKGAYVISIDPNSPLSGKILKGDIILSMEDQKIDTGTDLNDLLLTYKMDQEIRLKYWRDDTETETTFNLK